ncbi:MAG: hypothetical protein RBU28_03590, partial [Bacteroidales bacterium]|nr:hypothetical protein [Bacteroidales bacterium]
MRKRFIITKPLSAGNTDEEWKDCLLQLNRIRNSGLRPLKFNIFIDGDGSISSFRDIKKKITDSLTSTFTDSTPTFSISAHPPESPGKVAVEALFAEPTGEIIETCFSGSLSYVKATSGSYKELWCCGIGCDSPVTDTTEASHYAFETLNKILGNEGMSMNNIVRQWNYIGNILGRNNAHQNYQLFNEVRHHYYQKYRTTPWYPSATGIGMLSPGTLIDFYALQSDDNNIVIPLDNPNQVKAYEYGQEVLVGQPVSTGLKNSPKFERAVLLLHGDEPTLFISGTASIIGQVTLGKGDVEQQTRITIENIKKLADPLAVTDMDERKRPCNILYRNIRVYVKNIKDFGPVRDICTSHFGEV